MEKIRELENAIKKAEKHYRDYDCYNLGDIEGAIERLEEAVQENTALDISSYGEKIRQIIRNSHYIDRVKRWKLEALAEIEATVQKDLITGKGLETFLCGSSLKIYLEGELLAIASGAQFSHQPTNNGTVAWLVSEVLDSSGVYGTQNQDIVYAVKRGAKPKIVYEEHGWSNGDFFRILPPEVTPEGKILVTILRKESEEKKIFTLDTLQTVL